MQSMSTDEQSPPPLQQLHAVQVAAAAALALAPGGCFITHLPSASMAAQSALELSSIAGAVFETVSLYYPSSAQISGADDGIWLIARNRRVLSQEAADSLAKSCSLFVDIQTEHEHTGGIQAPQDLRDNFVAVYEWAANRAEAELAFVKHACEGPDATEALSGLGQRWGTFVCLSSMVDTKPKSGPNKKVRCSACVQLALAGKVWACQRVWSCTCPHSCLHTSALSRTTCMFPGYLRARPCPCQTLQIHKPCAKVQRTVPRSSV